MSEKKLFLGAAAGLGAAIIGAIAWAIVTVTIAQAIAIAVGAFVGFALRIGNGGKAFGILGALLALFGCALGNYLSLIAFASAQQHIDFFTMLNNADPAKVAGAMWDDLLSGTIFFYAIALYEGYKFAVVRGAKAA